MEKSYNFAIIGAGITALSFARLASPARCLLIEKSRGVGGRLATRRLGDFWINHGPTSFQIRDSLLDELVLEAPGGFFSLHNQTYTAEAPTNTWAKLIAHDMEIKRECKVHGFKNTTHGYELLDENKKHICFADQIVLTTPAPQAKEILENSNLDASFLDVVSYESNVQFMALTCSELPAEKENGSFYSLKMKASPKEGVHLYHFEVRDEALWYYLELEKEEIQKRFINELNLINFSLMDCHAHKWRYSTVRKGIDSKFQRFFSHQKIWLAGDYFFGNDLNAAVVSAKALVIS